MIRFSSIQAIRLGAILLAATACREADAPRATAARNGQSAPSMDSTILATALDSFLPRNATVLAIRELTVDSAGWLTGNEILTWVAAELPGVRQETLQAFRIAAANSGDARAIFGEQARVRWIPESRAEHEPPRDLVQHLRVTRVAYAADSLQALVYMSTVCGGLCGRGEYVVLERDPRRGWTVRGRLIRVIS